MTIAERPLFSGKEVVFHSLCRTWCEQIWDEHKHTVMLRGATLYRELAREIARRLDQAEAAGETGWSRFAEWLANRLADIQAGPVDERDARDALLRVFGWLEAGLAQERRDAWRARLKEDWRGAWRELFVLVMARGDERLRRSRLFSPEVPATHTWVRHEDHDWFVRRTNGEWQVLSPEEVKREVSDGTVAKLAEYRLVAQLGELTDPLDMYAACLGAHGQV